MARQLDALTGIRAPLVWIVVITHFQLGLYTLFPSTRLFSPFLLENHVVVDAFFVISGFIIAYNYWDHFARFRWITFGRFLWFRLARIYPVHLFSLATVYVALHTVGLDEVRTGTIHFSDGSLLRQLLLVASWDLPRNTLSWNAPSWSLSAEWFAYLLFPFLVLVLARRRWPTPLLVAGIFTAMILMPLAIELTGSRLPSRYAIIRISAGFPAGMLMFLLYQRGFADKLPWGVLAPAAGIAALAGIAVCDRLGVNSLFTAPIWAVMVYGLLWDQGPMHRWLTTRPAMFWGEHSYSVYMTHFTALIVLAKFLEPDVYAHHGMLTRALVVAAFVLACAATAAITYAVVEAPLRRRMARMVGRLDRGRTDSAP